MCLYQAYQQIRDWRSSFGASAVSALVAFLEDPHHARVYDKDSKRQSFCDNQLKNYRFMYKNAQDDPKV